MGRAKTPVFQTFQVILGLGPGIPYREVRAFVAHLRETCNVVRAEMLDGQDIRLRRFYADVHANQPKAQDLEVSIRLRVVSFATDPVVFGDTTGRFVSQLWLNDYCLAV